MRKPILSSPRLALAVSITCAVGCGEDTSMMMMPPPEPPLNERVSGTWESQTCEAAGSLMGFSVYVKRKYVFTTTAWDVKLTLYGDQGCGIQFLGFDAKGGFTVGQDASTPMGAKEAEFTITERGATPYQVLFSPMMPKDILNTIMCGGYTNWMAGVRQDISAQGCMGIVPSVASCPKEFELMKLDAATLQLS